MRAVCIARHCFLSEHIASVFRDAGIECEPVVGFHDGMVAARSRCADVVICDYDLLVAAPLEEWERDPFLAEIPVIAVSLTRRPEEAHLLDANGIAGFLYLPTMDDATASRIVRCARGVRAPDGVMGWRERQRDALRSD